MSSERNRILTWTEAARLLGLVSVFTLVGFGALALAAHRYRGAWTRGWALPGLSLRKQMGQWMTLEQKIRFAEGREPVDVVAVGDSSCLRGFDPATFAEVTGRSALNLGTHGRAEMGGHLAILRRMVDRGGVREAVVLWIHSRAARPAMAPGDPMNFRPWVERRLRDPESVKDGLLAATNDLWGGLLRFRLLKRNRARTETHGFSSHLGVAEIMERHDGWLPGEPTSFAGRDRQVSPHPDALLGMQRIRDLCRSQELRLYVVINPFVEGSPIEQGHMGQLRSTLAAALPGATIVDETPAFLPARLFINQGHFAVDGARLVTGQVARFVRDRR